MYQENHKYIWRFKDYPFVKITENKLIVNTKTGRKKKECMNNYSIGYWITSKRFILTSDINSHVEKIPKKIEYYFN